PFRTAERVDPIDRERRAALLPARVDAFDCHDAPLAGALAQLADFGVLWRAVPLADPFDRRELDDDQALRIPTALERRDATTATEVAAAVAFDGRGRGRGVARGPLSVGDPD